MNSMWSADAGSRTLEIGGGRFDEAGLRALARAKDAAGLRALLDGWFEQLRRDLDADIRQVRVDMIECVTAVCDELARADDPPEGLRAARRGMLLALTQARHAQECEEILAGGVAMLVAADARSVEVGSRYTAEAVATVRRDYGDPSLSIQTIAAHLHVNPAYLGRTFFRDTGQHFSDYLNAYRIGVAKELLQRPGVRIRQVGEQVGYVSASYFAQVFRQQTGVSPSQWRR